MNTKNKNTKGKGKPELPQVLEEVDGTIHIFAAGTNPDDIAFGRAKPIRILPAGTSWEEAIRIAHTMPVQESVSDFKTRLASMIPKPDTKADRPCLRQPTDRGYYPPSRKVGSGQPTNKQDDSTGIVERPKSGLRVQSHVEREKKRQQEAAHRDCAYLVFEIEVKKDWQGGGWIYSPQMKYESGSRDLAKDVAELIKEFIDVEGGEQL